MWPADQQTALVDDIRRSKCTEPTKDRLYIALGVADQPGSDTFGAWPAEQQAELLEDIGASKQLRVSTKEFIYTALGSFPPKVFLVIHSIILCPDPPLYA